MTRLDPREERRELIRYRQGLKRREAPPRPSRCPHCGASSNIFVEIEDIFRVRRKNSGLVRETREKRVVRAYPSFDGHCHYCGE